MKRTIVLKSVVSKQQILFINTAYSVLTLIKDSCQGRLLDKIEKFNFFFIPFLNKTGDYYIHILSVSCFM